MNRTGNIFVGTLTVLLAVSGCKTNEGTTLKIDYLNPEYYMAYFTQEPIITDGVMEEKAWEEIPWTNSFVDLFIEIKTHPPYDTKVKMLWDDRYFYFAAKMEEPHVMADFVTRDTVICLENDFEIFADPDGDNMDYFEFEMNARGTVWDLFLSRAYRDTVNPDNSWDIHGLKTGIKIDGTLNDASDTDKGWVTEVAVPWTDMESFANMPCPPHENDQWRVNFLRVEYIPKIINGKYEKDKTNPANNSSWSPHHSTGIHDPESFGIVQFTRKPFGTAELIPDRSIPARSILMQIYYAQRKYFNDNGRFASSLKELGLIPENVEGVKAINRFEMKPPGYVATVELSTGNGKVRWHVNEISKLWKDLS